MCWLEHLLYVSLGTEVVVEIRRHESLHWVSDNGDVFVVS